MSHAGNCPQKLNPQAPCQCGARFLSAKDTRDERIKFMVRAIYAAYMLDAWHREGFKGSLPRDGLESWLDAAMEEFGDFKLEGVGHGQRGMWEEMLSEARLALE